MPGGTTKLGPLASTDLCAWVKGLLDKLITHLGLGSSSELPLGEPWGIVDSSPTCLPTCLGNLGVSSAISLGVSDDCLRRGANCWAVSTHCLWRNCTISLGNNADCLGRYADCLGISVIYLGTTCLERTISLGVSAGCLGTTCLWGAALSPWEIMLNAWEEAVAASPLSSRELPA